MNTKKFLIGGIVGGITFFLLGWLVYGILMKDQMADMIKNSPAGVMKAQEDMIWWALILSNFAMGFLMSYVFNRAGVMSAMNGLITGAILGFLLSLGYDMMMFSMMNLMKLNDVWMDVLMSTVFNGVGGMVIGAVLGMGGDKAKA